MKKTLRPLGEIHSFLTSALSAVSDELHTPVTLPQKTISRG